MTSPEGSSQGASTSDVRDSSKDPTVHVARLGLWQAVLVALIGAAAGLAGGLVKTSPDPVPVPSGFDGMIAYFEATTCPGGWAAYPQAQGRYVVGLLPPGGTAGKTVGLALENEENRPTGEHTHAFKDEAVGGSGDIVVGGRGYRRGPIDSVTAPTGKPGTNAPYVQLLACQKLKKA